MSEQCISIIDQLIELRKEKNMSQREVATASGLTQSVIARLESKKAMPQLNTLIKIASALDCRLSFVSM